MGLCCKNWSCTGVDTPILKSVNMTVRGKPPQLSVGTAVIPAKPPYISPKKTANPAIQPAAKIREPLRFHSPGQAERTSISTIAAVAIAGRHCSSYGKRPKIIRRHFSATKPQHAPLA